MNKPSNKQICLQVLRAAKRENRPATTGEFMRSGAGERFGARIHELRREGHEISSWHHREGSAYYELVHDAESGAAPVGTLSSRAEPDDTTASPAAVDAGAGLDAGGQLFPVPEDEPLHPLTSPEAA